MRAGWGRAACACPPPHLPRFAQSIDPPPQKGGGPPPPPAGGGFDARKAKRQTPLTIEGELIAKSTGAASSFAVGERVFHQKFGNGNVAAIDGNKLTIDFDRAGQKKVLDGFVTSV